MRLKPQTIPSLNPTQVADLKFPSMPYTLGEVMRLRAQGTPDVEKLIEIVKRDPAVAAVVLKRVNSAFFGLSRKIVQVDKAVNLLGYKEIFGLVLAAAVKQTFAFQGTEEAAAIHRHIMRHSLATAAFAKILAEVLSPIATETAFTAGLLHELGRMTLLASIPKPYTELWIRLSPTRNVENLITPTPAMERFVFKVDYTQIGAIIAQHWNLPDEMKTIIKDHPDPISISAPYLRTQATLVAIGHAVASELFEPVDRTAIIAELFDGLNEIRSLNPHTLTTLLFDKRDEVREFVESMIAD